MANLKREDIWPDEFEDLYDEARAVVGNLTNVDHWMNRPHAWFGGMSPNQAIEKGHGQLVRDLLRAIKYGDFT